MPGLGIAGLLANGAPVIAAVRRIHAIAEKAGDDHAERFHFRQAPHGGDIPALLFGFRILFKAGHTLDLGADQSGKRLGRNEGGTEGNERRANGLLSPTSSHGVACRFVPRLKEHKSRHAKAEKGTYIEALHDGHADRHSSQGGFWERAVLRCAVQRGQGQENGPQSQGARGQTPAGIGESIGVQRRRQRSNECKPWD